MRKVMVMSYLFIPYFGKAAGLEGLWPGRGANIFNGYRQKEKGGKRRQINRPLQKTSYLFRNLAGTARPSTL